MNSDVCGDILDSDTDGFAMNFIKNCRNVMKKYDLGHFYALYPGAGCPNSMTIARFVRFTMSRMNEIFISYKNFA